MTQVIAAAGALQSYVDKWLSVQPQQQLALTFVHPRHYPGHVALAALEQELLAAAYGIREPLVASSKLGWWAEELSSAASTGGRHPLTQLLFADERAYALPPDVWLAPVLAAMAQLEQGTATDFSFQLDGATPLHGALAVLETAWWYGRDQSPERAARHATLAHLLHALRRLQDDLERDRLPLPMARLARHGLGRNELRKPSASRDAAVKEQLAELRQAWREAAALPGPLTVFRAMESRSGLILASRASKAADALALLEQGLPRGGVTATFAAWQAARRWLQRAC